MLESLHCFFLVFVCARYEKKPYLKVILANPNVKICVNILAKDLTFFFACLLKCNQTLTAAAQLHFIPLTKAV